MMDSYREKDTKHCVETARGTDSYHNAFEGLTQRFVPSMGSETVTTAPGSESYTSKRYKRY
jgi:hypothetical protein